MSLSFVAGYSTGYVMKLFILFLYFINSVLIEETSKKLMVVGGMAFLGIQFLAYKGYLDVHWQKMENDVKKVINVDKNGNVFNYYFMSIYYIGK